MGLFELDSWQCQGFGEAGISPNVAVFTTFMPDHMNYYKGSMDAYLADKAQIFLNQKPEDVLVVGASVVDRIKKTYGNKVRSRLVVADPARFPKAWTLLIPGEHNIANALCAIEAARALGIDDKLIREAVASYAGVPGRLQFLKQINGVKVYNDNNATTPDATIAGLRGVGDPSKRNVVLIMGGDDKQLDMTELVEEIPKWCSKVVLFKERGTERIRDAVFALANQGILVYEEEGLKSTVERAFAVALPGETILYSPAFSSFGKYFSNEFDRNDQFVALLANL
jgi:UDP-N-acetylmuramoylalanine--D-glutamate ligase